MLAYTKDFGKVYAQRSKAGLARSRPRDWASITTYNKHSYSQSP